jgi:hypothetical protein
MAAEIPYPEFEAHWEKVEPPACPNCPCCSGRLCAKAAMNGTVCAFEADDPVTTRNCPCSARSERTAQA